MVDDSSSGDSGMSADIRPHVRNYIAVFEALGPARLDELVTLCAEDVRFSKA